MTFSQNEQEANYGIACLNDSQLVTEGFFVVFVCCLFVCFVVCFILQEMGWGLIGNHF